MVFCGGVGGVKTGGTPLLFGVLWWSSFCKVLGQYYFVVQCSCGGVFVVVFCTTPDYSSVVGYFVSGTPWYLFVVQSSTCFYSSGVLYYKVLLCDYKYCVSGVFCGTKCLSGLRTTKWWSVVQSTFVVVLRTGVVYFVVVLVVYGRYKVLWCFCQWCFCGTKYRSSVFVVKRKFLYVVVLWWCFCAVFLWWCLCGWSKLWFL